MLSFHHCERPHMRGKFIAIADAKFFVRGVTYGTFALAADGSECHDPAVVERDFAQMAASGINAVRTYTVPPRWLLDAALRHGLRVMVGLPWEQHVTFLDDRTRAAAIEERVRAGVRACAGHPALLCYAIGNEIPATIVRWHGHRRIERFLKRLYRAAKAEDPDGLVTYVNYPTTEYLDLSFLDFLCFNVYLEDREKLEAYLARLHVLAGDRPLVLAEIGLDSRRNGMDKQAAVLDWQVRTVFTAGCAGAFVFAWTDEWYRGGREVADWDFGLTDRQRHPKPALSVVRAAFMEVPFHPDTPWPQVSVVVCSYNGARTIRETCEGLAHLDYPAYEVIVVDDGSSDETAAIAREYPVRVISTANNGLSSARNVGMAVAVGEIVAYLDDDAIPDPHWLQYLAATFLTTEFVGAGGPNIAPLHDGLIAACVDNAPGNPIHVLLSDREAEHIPGCNMAFRKTALEAVGGFDPQLRVAGDDVDVCWRLRERGAKLGYSPAAMVWHHRRKRIRTYWRQQKGYGEAEAILERKWPGKYNTAGHIPWSGRIYGKGVPRALGLRQGRIYHGVWNSAPFQSLYEPARTGLSALVLMPEWYLVIAVCALLVLLGILDPSLLALALPLCIAAVGALLVQAGRGGARATFVESPRSRIAVLGWQCLVALLHLMQPLARLSGRLRHDLTPWRLQTQHGLIPPLPRVVSIWSEQWHDAGEWLRDIESASTDVNRGGDYDRWDLEVHGGLLAGARLRLAIEEHGGGTQLVRIRVWPRVAPFAVVIGVVLAILALEAGREGRWGICATLGLLAAMHAIRALYEAAAAVGTAVRSLERLADPSA